MAREPAPQSAIERIRQWKQEQAERMAAEKANLLNEVCEGIKALNEMGDEFKYSLRYGIKSVDLDTGEIIEPKTGKQAV
jgi:hypothetical protein